MEKIEIIIVNLVLMAIIIGVIVVVSKKFSSKKPLERKIFPEDGKFVVVTYDEKNNEIERKYFETRSQAIEYDFENRDNDYLK